MNSTDYLMFAAAGETGALNPVMPLKQGALTLAQRFEDATGLPPIVGVWVVNIIGSLIILFVGYFVANLSLRLIKKVGEKRKIDQTVSSFAGNLAHAMIMTFVVVTALGQLGVDTKSFAAIIAAAGLAIGLALQGGLANFAAGFLIIIFRPFRKGDAILGGGVEGVVEEVQVFSTTLNTPDNKRIIIPNSSLMASTITNYTANPIRRADVPFSVGAGQDLNQAHKALLSLANADPRILKNPAPAVANTKLVEGGTQVELRAWCKTSEHGDVLSDLIAKGPLALASASIKGPDKTVYYVERKLT